LAWGEPHAFCGSSFAQTLKSAPLVRGYIPARLVLLELVLCFVAVRWCLPRRRELQIGYEQSEGVVGTMADTDLRDSPIRSAAGYAAVTVAFRVG
jgi:hypothetical protein